MLFLWYSELEILCRHFWHTSLSGETGNMPSRVAGHGFTEAAMIRWEGAVKPKTRFSLGQGDEIQTFNMQRRVSREFVAGPCLRNFMKQRQLPNEPFALLRCRQAYMFLLFSKNWIVVLGLCSRWQCFNNCKFEDPKMSLWLKFESLGKFGNYRIPLGHSNFAGYKYLAPSAGQLRCLWVLLGPWNFGRQKRGGSRQMVPSPEPFVSLLQICWWECPQTSHHPTTNTLIPEMELEVLQQRGNRKLWSEWKDATHSWVPRASTKALWCTQGVPTFAFWFATPLWSSRSHWNCQILFCPNLNSIAPRVLRWFTAPPQLHWKLHLLDLQRMEETSWFKALLLTQHWVLFHSRSLLRLMINYPDLRNCFSRTKRWVCFPPRQAKLCAKVCSSGRLSIGQKHVWLMFLTKTKCGKQIHIWAHVLCGQYIYRSPRCSQEGS